MAQFTWGSDENALPPSSTPQDMQEVAKAQERQKARNRAMYKLMMKQKKEAEEAEARNERLRQAELQGIAQAPESSSRQFARAQDLRGKLDFPLSGFSQGLDLSSPHLKSSDKQYIYDKLGFVDE